MAQEIPSYNATGRLTPNYEDRFFDATALPNATSIESGVFRAAQVGARVEIEVRANTDITIADTQSLTFELFYDKDEDGSFTDSKVVKAISASGSAVSYLAGDVIFVYTPDSDVEHFVKIEVTATADQSAGAIDGNLYYNYN